MVIKVKENQFEDFFLIPSASTDSFTSIDELKQYFYNKNISFEGVDSLKFFTVYLNDKCVGRVSIEINKKYNDHHNSKIGFGGFFDCIDDELAKKALLTSAMDWQRERGIKSMSLLIDNKITKIEI